MSQRVALIVRGAAPLSPDELERRIRADLLPSIEGLREFALPRRPPRFSVIPFATVPAALVIADRSPPPVSGLSWESHRIESAYPLAAPPLGPALLTVFSRRAGLDDASFFDHWHRGHTPLAMAVHPMTRYARHVVTKSLDGAPERDGIVLEGLEGNGELHPWRFFGGRGHWVLDMFRVGLDARRFIDLATIENHLVEMHPGNGNPSP